MPTLATCALLVATTLGALPAPMPSGMDLLYDDRVVMSPTGEPLVALGLMSGQARVAVRGRGGLIVDWYEGEVFKRSQIPAGAEVVITVGRARQAKRMHVVDLEGVPYGDELALAQARARWKQRGVGPVQVIEEGVALGIGGHTIDNREYRLWLPQQSAEKAAREAARIYERFSERVTTNRRLLERPWAELAVQIAGVPMGKAVSYVRFNGDGGLIEIADVEHGKGYSWEGRETRAYDGEVYVAVDPDGKLAAVNVVSAERLLDGVVPSEIPASAPAEALKAQAVAARNQLFAKLGRRHHDDPYHLCAAQHCQVYSGTSREDPRASAAVRATSGEVLFREGRLVDTVYSSTCGGHTENNEVVWGNRPDPALRGRPDFDVMHAASLSPFIRGVDATNLSEWLRLEGPTYCSTAPQARADKFRWERSFDRGELTQLLAKSHSGLGRLKDLVPGERGPGGRVHSLTLVGERGSAVVLLELPIRQLFANLNSGAFTVEVERDAEGLVSRAVFRGAGWGHGVGMCQLGAIGRAQTGHTYKDILDHYYNGARVERVYEGIGP